VSRGEDINIKQAIDQLLDQYKIRKKFDETAVVAAWPEVMGTAIANRTQNVYVRDRRLYVKIESAVVKNELVLMRSQILARLNEHVGQVLVDDLVIL
jgi:predicted nucleic acid-binding Zn ribbon protein